MARKVILSAAVNGAFVRKAANAGVPEQPDEIAQTAKECYDAGAAIVHYHVRGKDGLPSSDPDILSDINSRIRAKCSIITQSSIVPVFRSGFSLADGLIALKADVLPEMCSVGGSLLYFEANGIPIFMDCTHEYLRRAAALLKERGMKAELELYNPSSIDDIVGLNEGCAYFAAPLSITMMFNMPMQGAMLFSQENLQSCRRRIPSGSQVYAMCSGESQMEAVVSNLMMGGNARVGMEDGIWYRNRELSKSNAQLVERMVRIIHEVGFEIATPEETRKILNMNGPNSPFNFG